MSSSSTMTRPSAVTEAQLWVSELTMSIAVTVFVAVITVLVVLFFGIWKFKSKVLPSETEAQRRYRFRKRDKVMFFGRKMLRKVKSFTRNTVGPSPSTGMRRKPSHRLMISKLRKFLAQRKDPSKPRIKQQSPPQSFLEADWSDIDEDHRLPPEVLYMLRSVRVFGHLEKPFFLELCRFMESITLRSGHFLFKIGDPDDSIYVVQHGMLEVYITDSDGSEHLVKHVHTGNSIHSLLSILDVLTGHPGTFRSVSARAVTDSTILRLPAHAFKSMFEKFNESAVKVVQIIMIRLQRVTFSALHNYLGLSKELLKPDGQGDTKELNIHRINRQSSSPSVGNSAKATGSQGTGQASEPGKEEHDGKFFPGGTPHKRPSLIRPLSDSGTQLTDFDAALMRARASITDDKSIVLSGSPPRRTSVLESTISETSPSSYYRSRPVPDEENILNLASKDLVQILGLKDPTLLEDRLSVSNVRAGSIFCKQGDQDTSLFFLVKGTVMVLQNVVGESDKETLMFQVEPGEIIDVLAVLTGEPSFFTMRAKSDAIMVVISKPDFYQIMRVEPFIVLNVAHCTVKRMSTFVRQIDFALDWQMLEAGKALFRQGDTSDSIFIVLTGRLRSVITSLGGKKELVNEFGRGELVGIVEVLTQHERATTVLAIRDTELTKIPSELLNLIKIRYPQVVARLIHLLGTRILGSLQQRNTMNLQAAVSLDNNSYSKVERTTVANLATIAIVPVTEDVPLTNFALELQHALLTIGPTVRLTPDIVKARLGTSALDGVNEFRLFNWLSQQEDIHRMVLYQCDHQLTKWSKHCLRQADCILIVGIADSEPTIGPIEQELESIAVRAQKELILLHRQDAETPKNTAEWLNVRGWLSSHHHLRCPKRVLKVKSRTKTLEMYERLFETEADKMTDFSRLARFLTGTSIGLVLGGGGARGLAHVGMIKAMEEVGIPIDMVGGTSMGAFIGALWAEERNYVRFTQRAREWSIGMTSLWKKIWDLTYPVASMFTGWAFNESIETVFKDRQIEDLWLPYFCITTNISNSSMRVHSLGSVWRYTRASMSLSGYLPPLCDPADGHLLLDGGYVNNLPADVMHSLGAKFVFAVDVGSQDEKDLTNYGDCLSGWWLLWKRWNPWASPIRVPDMTEIQSRLAYVSCVRQLEVVKNSDYCEYIRPPIDRYATLQFGSYDEIVETGYHHGKTMFSAWAKGGLLDKLFKEKEPPKQEVKARREGTQTKNNMPVMAYFTDLAEQVSKIKEPERQFYLPEDSEEDVVDDNDEDDDHALMMEGYEEDDEFANTDGDEEVSEEGEETRSERRKVTSVNSPLYKLRVIGKSNRGKFPEVQRQFGFKRNKVKLDESEMTFSRSESQVSQPERSKVSVETLSQISSRMSDSMTNSLESFQGTHSSISQVREVYNSTEDARDIKVRRLSLTTEQIDTLANDESFVGGCMGMSHYRKVRNIAKVCSVCSDTTGGNLELNPIFSAERKVSENIAIPGRMEIETSEVCIAQVDHFSLAHTENALEVISPFQALNAVPDTNGNEEEVVGINRNLILAPKNRSEISSDASFQCTTNERAKVDLISGIAGVIQSQEDEEEEDRGSDNSLERKSHSWNGNPGCSGTEDRISIAYEVVTRGNTLQTNISLEYGQEEKGDVDIDVVVRDLHSSDVLDHSESREIPSTNQLQSTVNGDGDFDREYRSRSDSSAPALIIPCLTNEETLHRSKASQDDFSASENGDLNKRKPEKILILDRRDCEKLNTAQKVEKEENIGLVARWLENPLNLHNGTKAKFDNLGEADSCNPELGETEVLNEKSEGMKEQVKKELSKMSYQTPDLDRKSFALSLNDSIQQKLDGGSQISSEKVLLSDFKPQKLDIHAHLSDEIVQESEVDSQNTDLQVSELTESRSEFIHAAVVDKYDMVQSGSGTRGDHIILNGEDAFEMEQESDAESKPKYEVDQLDGDESSCKMIGKVDLKGLDSSIKSKEHSMSGQVCLDKVTETCFEKMDPKNTGPDHLKKIEGSSESPMQNLEPDSSVISVVDGSFPVDIIEKNHKSINAHEDGKHEEEKYVSLGNDLDSCSQKETSSSVKQCDDVDAESKEILSVKNTESDYVNTQDHTSELVATEEKKTVQALKIKLESREKKQNQPQKFFSGKDISVSSDTKEISLEGIKKYSLEDDFAAEDGLKTAKSNKQSSKEASETTKLYPETGIKSEHSVMKGSSAGTSVSHGLDSYGYWKNSGTQSHGKHSEGIQLNSESKKLNSERSLRDSKEMAECVKSDRDMISSNTGKTSSQSLKMLELADKGSQNIGSTPEIKNLDIGEIFRRNSANFEKFLVQQNNKEGVEAGQKCSSLKENCNTKNKCQKSKDASENNQKVSELESESEKTSDEQCPTDIPSDDEELSKFDWSLNGNLKYIKTDEEKRHDLGEGYNAKPRVEMDQDKPAGENNLFQGKRCTDDAMVNATEECSHECKIDPSPIPYGDKAIRDNPIELHNSCFNAHGAKTEGESQEVTQPLKQSIRHSDHEKVPSGKNFNRPWLKRSCTAISVTRATFCRRPQLKCRSFSESVSEEMEKAKKQREGPSKEAGIQRKIKDFVKRMEEREQARNKSMGISLDKQQPKTKQPLREKANRKELKRDGKTTNKPPSNPMPSKRCKSPNLNLHQNQVVKAQCRGRQVSFKSLGEKGINYRSCSCGSQFSTSGYLDSMVLPSPNENQALEEGSCIKRLIYKATADIIMKDLITRGKCCEKGMFHGRARSCSIGRRWKEATNEEDAEKKKKWEASKAQGLDWGTAFLLAFRQKKRRCVSEDCQTSSSCGTDSESDCPCPCCHDCCCICHAVP